MGRLYGIFKKMKQVPDRRFMKVLRTVVFLAITPAILSVLFCFREDVLKKVDKYNSSESGNPPYYIEVVSVSPSSGAVGIGTAVDIKAVFNDNIDMTTVDQFTFSVNGGTVAGTFTYDPILKTVIFTPDVDLSYSTLYTVTLTTGIKNDSGNGMAANYTWFFTTIAQNYISVVSVFPSDGTTDVSTNTVVEAVFNDNIDMSTVDTSTFRINGGAITGTFTYDPILKKIIFTPAASLSYSSIHTVTLTTGIKNNSGDTLFTDYTWFFVTAAQYFISVISVSPADTLTGVSVTSDILVEFNDNIDMLTVDSSSFSVNGGAVAGAYTYDAQLKTVAFNPAVDLLPLTLYTVNLTTGIMNVSGESMAAAYTWSFTTGIVLQPEIYILPPSPLVEIFSGDGYNFGNDVNPGTKTAVFTIGNSGVANLNITGTSLSDSLNFSVSAITALPITPGSTTTFTVTFQPDGIPGIENSVLTITSNDPDELSFIINLTGEELASPAPEIQFTDSGVILVSPVSTVDFGTLVPGDTASIAIMLHNIGSADLVITGAVIGGTNPDLFSTDFIVPATVTPGSTSIFNMSFSAPAAINARATITFQNNDLNESLFTIKLKGRVK